MMNRYKSVLYFLMAYGVIISVIMAFRTKALVNDIVVAFKSIGNGIMALWSLVGKGTDMAAGLGDKIPQVVVAAIVHWLLWGLVYVGVIGMIGIFIFICGKKVYEAFREKLCDEATVYALLVDMAVVGLLGDVLKGLVPVNINLLVVFMVVMLLYVVVRCVVHRDSEKKSKLLWIVGEIIFIGIVGVVLYKVAGAMAFVVVPVAVVIVMAVGD